MPDYIIIDSSPPLPPLRPTVAHPQSSQSQIIQFSSSAPQANTANAPIEILDSPSPTTSWSASPEPGPSTVTIPAKRKPAAFPLSVSRPQHAYSSDEERRNGSPLAGKRRASALTSSSEDEIDLVPISAKAKGKGKAVEAARKKPRMDHELPPCSTFDATSLPGRSTTTKSKNGLAMTAEEKKKEKEREKKEKDARKAEEKREKARDGEANKLKTKSDMLRDLRLHLSPTLYLPTSPLFPSLQSLTTRLSNDHCSLHLLPDDYLPSPPPPAPAPGVIKFQRHVRAHFDVAARVWVPLEEGRERWVEERVVVLLVRAEELAGLILGEGKEGEEGLRGWEAVGRWYKEWAGMIAATITTGPGDDVGGVGESGLRPELEVVMIIHGMKSYLSKGRNVQTKKHRAEVEEVWAGLRDVEEGLMVLVEDDEGDAEDGRRSKQKEKDNENGKVKAKGKGKKAPKAAKRLLTMEEFDGVLTKLSMKERCFQVQVDSKGEMEEWIWNLSADLAYRPIKKIEQSHLPFHAGVVAKGKDPQHTFRLMLEKIPGITDSAADGIVKRHGSFGGLMRAWEKMEEEEKGRMERGERGVAAKERKENMLVGIPIRNTASGAEMDRLIGQTTSSKIYNVFRGQDGSALIREKER